MRDLGIDRAELSRRLEISPDTLANEWSRSFASRGLRWRIEAVLGYVAVFNDPAQIILRKRCVARFGFDPCLISRPALIEQCRVHWAPCSHRFTFQQLVESFLGKLAARPSKLK